MNTTAPPATLPDLTRLPGCLFLSSYGPRNMLAKALSGDLLHVSEVEPKTPGLTCPDCGQPLLVKKGNIRVHHFAHAPGQACPTSGETVLHQMAKTILVEAGELELPEVKTHRKRLFPEAPGFRAVFDRVEIERWSNGLRYDLVAHLKWPNHGYPTGRPLVIEIHVAHRVDPDKQLELITRGDPALEINLSRVRGALSYEDLARLLLNTAPRTWLAHPALEAFWRRAGSSHYQQARRQRR